MSRIVRKLAGLCLGVLVLVGGAMAVVDGARAGEGPKATREDMARGKARYKALLEEKGLDPKRSHEVRLDVFKADRRLELYASDVLLATYRVALGWSPKGDKEVEGDGRTPEGEYRVVTRHTSKFHLFLGLDYPNEEDVARALEAKRIDEKTAKAVRAKLEAGEKPPWDTPMGGAIGVHGGGRTFDWTAGCVAVENEEIEVVYAAAKMGTRVRVFP